jgi:hypothetical protein
MSSNVVNFQDAQKTLQPPAGLVTPQANPNDPPLFCLFTQDWLDLQTFIAQALQLPITTGDFESKYGTFTDEKEIEDCISAMQAVQALSVDFGDPLALIKELASNPAILQTDTAPTPIYTHIVWFATKLYRAATTFNQTLGQFMTLLNPANCGTPTQCGAILVQVLTGPGGLQSTATSMVQLANDLTQALAQFTLKLKPSVDTMSDYTAQSSTFYADVNAAIKTDTDDVTSYQDAADAAYKLWRDLTISAITTSVGVLVLTGGMGWPVSAALAGGLGDAAQKARDAYDKACAQRDAADADEKKKITLKADLDGFNKQMKPVSDAATNFQKTLQQVTAVWAGIAGDLDFISKNFTPEQLGSLSWLMQALALDRATSDWKTIADAASAYTANSLVTYHIVPFGAPLPADQAA